MSEKLINFVQKRKEAVEQKRRTFERILFQNMFGAYTVLDRNGVITPISLVDISHDGCLFKMPWNKRDGSCFSTGEEHTVRFYFTKDSFIPVILTIRYAREYVDNDGQVYIQYGTEFDKTTSGFGVMKSFIEFLYNFADLSVTDKGDSKVYFL